MCRRFWWLCWLYINRRQSSESRSAASDDRTTYTSALSAAASVDIPAPFVTIPDPSLASAIRTCDRTVAARISEEHYSRFRLATAGRIRLWLLHGRTISLCAARRHRRRFAATPPRRSVAANSGRWNRTRGGDHGGVDIGFAWGTASATREEAQQQHEHDGATAAANAAISAGFDIVVDANSATIRWPAAGTAAKLDIGRDKYKRSHLVLYVRTNNYKVIILSSTVLLNPFIWMHNMRIVIHNI